MRKPKVYLSGGMGKFGKENFELSDKWRRMVTAELKDKFDCFNPNDHFNFKSTDLSIYSEREIMDFDIECLLRSDIVIYYDNDPKSIGSAMEIALAYAHKIPVYIVSESNEVLHPWIVSMSRHIFSNFTDCILYLTDHYNY